MPNINGRRLTVAVDLFQEDKRESGPCLYSRDTRYQASTRGLLRLSHRHDLPQLAFETRDI